MENKKQLFINDTALTLTTVIPIALSMAVCSGMGTFAGAVFSALSSLLLAVNDKKQRMPVYLSFLIVLFAFKEHGIATASLAVIISGILLIALCKSSYSQKIPAETYPAIMITGALTITVLFTTDYFGIGATGNTVREMIASYISLGFHPNWRGILYGTIVMVVMITFPRKFKKATKTVDFAFVAIIITTVLSLFLNPSDMAIPINEIGTPSFLQYKSEVFLPIIKSFGSISFSTSLVGGLALCFLSYTRLAQDKTTTDKDIIINGAANCFFGALTCLPVPAQIRKKNILHGVTASVITVLIYVLLHSFIARVPLHSCAVVLIVGAWSSVNWKDMKLAFSSTINVALFILIVLTSLLLGISYGVIIATCLGLLINVTRKKKT